MKCFYSYSTIIGKITIKEAQGYITAVSCNVDVSGSIEKETALIKQAYSEILEYFDEKRTKFDIPIKYEGTDFQKRVWQELQKISYGQTYTYKDIAIRISNPNAYRAVGNACNKNPILLFVPCHRGIGSNKSLTGFALGIDVKEKLINLEAKVCTKN